MNWPMPDSDTKYERNDAGDVIDPPVIPRYERDLLAAASAADQDGIDATMQEYTEAREARVRAHDARVDERAGKSPGTPENVLGDAQNGRGDGQDGQDAGSGDDADDGGDR